MIQSMTGYGKAEQQTKNKKFIIELRSLNSKNIDLKTRIPSVYREKEIEIRKLISKHLERGKIDFLLNIENLVDINQNIINKNILVDYLNQLESIHPNADDTNLISACLRLPDVLKHEKEVLDEQEWESLKKTIQAAIDKLIEYRKDEGKSIEKDLLTRIKHIRKYLKEINEFDQGRIEKIKEKLREAINQLQINVDENRFEQELIYYLEKYDINEEKVRLNNHLDYFEKELASNHTAKGKKLGFISQEMGREINTMGSKSNDSGMQQLVVGMKDELEKIKEQILNSL